MPASATLLHSENNSTDGSSNFVSASVTLDPGFLYIMDIGVTRNAGVPPGLTVTQTGVTWVSVQSNAFNTIASTRSRRQSFRTAVTSQQTGTVTVAFSTDRNSLTFAITKWSGTVDPGTDGVDAIQQTISGRADATTDFELTFGAAVAASNGLHVSWASDGASGDTVTLENSLVSLADQSQTADAIRSVSAYLANAIDTFSISGTSRDVAMLGIEIKALQGGNFGGPTRGLLRGVGRGMVR